MEEEIGRDLSLYVRTSSSTLGPTGPAAVPVLAMDVNPYPDVNCVIQCGDTFNRSENWRTIERQAHTHRPSRFSIQISCLPVCLSTNDSVACRPGTLISQIIHTYNTMVCIVVFWRLDDSNILYFFPCRSKTGQCFLQYSFYDDWMISISLSED